MYHILRTFCVKMYKKLAIVTIAAVYFLILVGGIVRATGAGMGCPDWPMCFGSWIPPTSIEQLPDNYQEIFGAKLKGEVEFNAFKTWTEYINRLVGVLIGFFIFGTLLAAFKKYRKDAPKVVWYSFLAFVLVGLEGYLGSKVVSTELNPALVTLHMVLALAVVFALIYALFLAYKHEGFASQEVEPSHRFALMLLIALSVGQLLLGTQVRQLVDVADLGGLERLEWIDTLGGRYYIHIGLAVIYVLVHLWFYKNIKKELTGSSLSFLKLLVGLVLGTFVMGGVLGVFNMPAFAQPLHLTLATLIFGVQFILFLIFNNTYRKV